MDKVLTSYQQLFQTVLQSCSSRASSWGQENLFAEVVRVLLPGCFTATKKDVDCKAEIHQLGPELRPVTVPEK